MNFTSGFSLDYDKEVEKCDQLRKWGHVRDIRNTKLNPDAKSPDGIVYFGQRIVSKKGTVRFAGEIWQTEFLLPFAGFQVGLCVWDYWITKIQVYRPDYPSGTYMFTLHSEREGDKERHEEYLLRQERIQEMDERNGGAYFRMPGLKLVKGRAE